MSELTLSARVGEAPTATISYHTGDKVQGVFAGSVIDTMAAQQAVMFESRKEPDVELEANDGDSGNVTFSGYMTAPVASAHPGQFKRSVSVMGTVARLGLLDLSIYKYGAADYLGDRGLFMQQFKAGDPKDIGDLAQVVKELTEAAVENLEPTRQATPEGVARTVLGKRHAINESALDIFYELLGNSDLTFEGWETLANYEPLRVNLLEKIRQILQQQHSSFWGVLQGLMQEFQLLYIPAWDGVGKLVRSDERALGDEDEKEVSVSMLDIGAGGAEILPLTGVVIKGPTAEFLPDRDNPLARFGGRARLIAGYPEDLGDGRILAIHLPSWLSADKSVVNFLAQATPSDGPQLDLKDSKDGLKDQDEQAKKGLQTLGDKILTEFAQVMYEDLRYANSTATARVPLDLSWEVGKRYSLKFSEGGSASGFLHSVRHAIYLGEGKTLSSGTSLNFTHIKL